MNLKEQTLKNRKIIYNITREVGRTYSNILKKKYGMTPQKLAEWDVNTLELSGLGKCKVILYDVKNRKSILRVFNSIMAKRLKPSKEPVDIFIAGYIAGSASVAFNSDKVVCEEIACEAMGHPYCEFHVAEKK
jgi:predicted hydrocarbon binding protein